MTSPRRGGYGRLPPARRVYLPARTTSATSREPGIALSVHEVAAKPAVLLCHGRRAGQCPHQ
jgi:hypothetical protein